MWRGRTFNGPPEFEQFAVDPIDNERGSRGMLSPKIHRNLKIIEEYKQGWGITELARRYNLSKQRINQLIIRHEVRPTDDYQRRRACQHGRTFDRDCCYWSNLDNILNRLTQSKVRHLTCSICGEPKTGDRAYWRTNQNGYRILTCRPCTYRNRPKPWQGGRYYSKHNPKEDGP